METNQKVPQNPDIPEPPPATVVLWATAPDPAAHRYDTLAALIADADSSLLLAEYNVYASLDGGVSWHLSEHRLVPPRVEPDDLADLTGLPAGLTGLGVAR